MRKSTGYLYETCTLLVKKYGPVFSMKIGKDRIVIVNDYQSIHSMLTNEDFDGRPTGPFYQTRTWGQRRGERNSTRPSIDCNNWWLFFQGVLVTDGPLWVEQRRFILRHLREFGFGRTTMASLIEEEAIHLVDHLKKLFEKRDNRSQIVDDNRNSVNNNGQIYQLALSRTDANEEMNKNNFDQEYSKNRSRPKRPLRVEDMYVKPQDFDEIRKLSQSYEIIISMNDVFGVPVLNTLWGMIAGKR